MATLPKYILKGIKYELSDVFRKKQIIELPESFDLKDPEVILEDCEVSNLFWAVSRAPARFL